MDNTISGMETSAAKLEGLITGFAWGGTALGPMEAWPAHVKFTVRLLLDSALPIVTLWGPDGVLIYNDAYARFAGARHPALLGAKVLEGWPEAADLNRRVLDVCLAGGTLSFRDEQLVLHRHSFPESTWLDLDYSPIRDEAGAVAGIFAVVVETTERMRLERQRADDIARLNAGQTRQRFLVELGDQLRRCDTAGQIAGVVSGALGRLLGCMRAGYAAIHSDHTVIENDWTDGTVPSLDGRHLYTSLGPRYIRKIRHGEILAVPDIMTHEATAQSWECWPPIGVRAMLNVPLIDNGVPVGLLYAHESRPRDWTPDEVSLVMEAADRTWEAMGRARAVEALRRMNGTLEGQVCERTAQRDRMWTLSTDLMMVTNAAGEILSVNPAWTALLGWREHELVGASFHDFLHPQDIAQTGREQDSLRQGRTIQKFENRYRRKAGDYVWLSWRAVPDGAIFHSVGRDVTAEREQALALQAAEESLRHTQKMEAVGQLTGGIAHDFNNLLQGIQGSLDLIQKRIGQGSLAGIIDYTAQARYSTERAGALTHRLLAFSRRQPLDPRPVQANQLVLDMAPLLRRTLGELILFELDLAADLWPALCDPHQLDSAVLNLAINARDAMPDGGTLTVRSCNVPDGPGRPLELPAGDTICLAITDTGIGMPRDVMDHAFDPFYTTKPIGQGTGLGLSMIYGFMRQSGGHAKIASTVGSGTTVSLYLPRYAGTAPVAALGEEASRPDVPRGHGTVLVLEDEPVVREIVLEVLEEAGFQTIQAETGPAGLEILQSARPVDLLVTDIGLPGLNGRQVAEAARLLRPDLKILFMTGYAETAAMAEGFLGPGMHMIAKPFRIGDLAALVQGIIEVV